MLNEFIGGHAVGGSLSDTPDPAWRLLGHAFTGYDWHGGYGFDSGRAGGTQGGGLFRRARDWWQARRQARELRRLTERDREDVGLVVTTPSRPPRAPFGVVAGAPSAPTSEMPGGPCAPRPC